MSVRTAAGARPAEWRRNLAAGLLLGLLVSAAEVSSQPLSVLSLTAQASLGVTLTVLFSLSGAVLALAIPPISGRFGVAATVLAFLGLCLVLGVVMTGVIVQLPRLAPTPNLAIGAKPDRLAVFFHTLFPLLFFGGLALTGYLFWRRASRASAFIAASMVAAADAEAEIARAAARDLRGQIQPERIADFLSEIRQRYRSDSAAGDRMLERLTDFLRAAMPAIRNGHSTLAAELDMLERYQALLRAGAGPPPAWRLAGRRGVPRDLAFPPLLLMQVLESLPAGLDPPVELRFGVRAGQPAVELCDPGGRLPEGWLDRDLAERLRLGLRRLHGAGSQVVAGGGGFPLQLRLGAPPNPAFNTRTGTDGP